ncbi:MAG TPA: hypothetical protein VKA69_01420 [Desulfobacteria bacterium]|nr:hypothetical protein [Desulfobacteria bacterium]
MKDIVTRPFSRIVFFLFVAFNFCGPHFTAAGDHPDSPGVQIHTSTVDGYQFDYTLYDFPKRKTQHLMVSIISPEGAPVIEGKAGFLVKGPDGAKQKAMTMGMKGAYGADMDFSQKGPYNIKTKAVVGDKKLFDQFDYEVK